MRIELKYLEHNTAQAEAERQSLQKTKPNKQKKRNLICLLLLVSIVSANAIYGLCTLEKGTPIWEAISTDNVIHKLWEKDTLNFRRSKNGLINGILFSKDNPLALINNVLVHEGVVIDGVRVVQITPHKIRFEKNGKVWMQAVLEKPHSVW